MRFILSNTCHAPSAAIVTAFSTYLTAFGIHVLLAAATAPRGAAPEFDYESLQNCGELHDNSIILRPGSWSSQPRNAEWGLQISERGLRQAQRKSPVCNRKYGIWKEH